MIFETERLYVRHWRKTDLQVLHELYGDPAIMEYILPVLTIEETRQIFNEQLLRYKTEPHLGRYMIVQKSSKSLIGIFMLRKPLGLDGIEIGYSFRKQDWGKGYATETVKKGVQYVFDSTAFKTVYAFTDVKNFNSKNVLLKSGFAYQCDVSEDGRPSNLFAIIKNTRVGNPVLSVNQV